MPGDQFSRFGLVPCSDHSRLMRSTSWLFVLVLFRRNSVVNTISSWLLLSIDCFADCPVGSFAGLAQAMSSALTACIEQ